MPNRILLLSVSASLIWWVTLGLLALLTANPVSLHYTQIKQADYVVAAKVVDLDSGSVRVENEWKRRATLQRIKIKNLKQVEATNNSTYLIPISRLEGDQFVVVTSLKQIIDRDGQIIRHDGHISGGFATVIERARDTGLPREVSKRPGDRVLAGSRLKDGRITTEFDMLRGPYIYPATPEAIEQLQNILINVAEND